MTKPSKDQGQENPTLSDSLAMLVRFVLALGLFLGFYLLAISISAFFFYIAFEEISSGGRTGRAVIFFVLVGLTVLFVVFPRRDPFPSPGPLLGKRSQPEFVKLVEEIAIATGGVMPEEIYLLREVDIWLKSRGGTLGFGSRPVLGIGLPLLAVLSVDQLRALLTHNFGHYYKGNSRFGPMIYHFREMVELTIRDMGNHKYMVAAPFMLYRWIFLRLTTLLVRKQEFDADALAARLIGSHPLVYALHARYSTAFVFEDYWATRVLPIINNGYFPPVAEGFQRYVQTPWVSALISDKMRTPGNEIQDPTDSHPPLAERLFAIEKFPKGTINNQQPSISLLNNISELEKDIFAVMGNHLTVRTLKPVTWEEVEKG